MFGSKNSKCPSSFVCIFSRSRLNGSYCKKSGSFTVNLIQNFGNS
ncbi:peptidase inhibitor family I36 protein [Gynuella sp.]